MRDQLAEKWGRKNSKRRFLLFFCPHFSASLVRLLPDQLDPPILRATERVVIGPDRLRKAVAGGAEARGFDARGLQVELHGVRPSFR